MMLEELQADPDLMFFIIFTVYGYRALELKAESQNQGIKPLFATIVVAKEIPTALYLCANILSLSLG